jgi:hypothetical protein
MLKAARAGRRFAALPYRPFVAAWTGMLLVTAVVAPAAAQTTWTVQSDYFAERNAIAQPRTIRSLALSSDGKSVYTGYIQSPTAAAGPTQIIRKVSSSVLAVPGADTVIFGNGAGPGAETATPPGLRPLPGNPIYPPAFGTPGFEAWVAVGAGQPRGLATDDRGNVYVSLRDSGVVRIYDANLSTTPLGAFGLVKPLGVAVRKLGSDYYAYVVNGSQVQRWNVTDVALPALDAAWTPPLVLTDPATPEGNGIAVDADGTVFVASSVASRVYRISPDGLTVTASAPINSAADVAVYQDRIYVVSRVSLATPAVVPPIVQLYKADLTTAGSDIVVPDFGTPRSSIAQLTGIEVSSDGKLFVSEENYLGTANGIPTYTPPMTSFNLTPTPITGRIYFDRVIVSDAIPPNLPPVVTSPDVIDGGTVQVKVGQTLDMSFLATDPEAGDMEFTATGLPPGATLTPNSGTTSASPFAVDLTYAPSPAEFDTSYVVTLSFEDPADKIGSITFTIEVPENEEPTVTTPTPVTVECTGGQNLVTLSVDVDDADDHPLTVTWKVNGVVEEIDHVATPPGAVDFKFDYPDGVNSVEVEVTDGYDANTASTTVTVQDTTSPVVVVAADVVVPTDPGEDFATGVVLKEPQVFDLCDGDPTLTNDAPSVYPLGETIVTWTATDADGNVATGEQKVTVVDREPPQIVGGENFAVFVDKGEIFATPNLPRPETTDNAPGKITVVDDAPSKFPIGNTRVTWTATDLAGNEATWSLVVKVVNRRPVADAGNDRDAVMYSRKGGELKLNGRGSRDPDRQDLTFSWSAPGVTFDDPSSPTPTGTFPIGNTNVILTVTDEAGVSDHDVVRVHVEYARKLVIDRRAYGPSAKPYVDEAIWRCEGLATSAATNPYFAAAFDAAKLAGQYDVAAASIDYVDGSDFPHRLGLYLHLRYYQSTFDFQTAEYLRYGYFYAPGVDDYYDFYLAGYVAASNAGYYGQADFESAN